MNMKKQTKPPTLELTLNWSGNIPRRLKKQFAALMKPKTFKFKLR